MTRTILIRSLKSLILNWYHDSLLAIVRNSYITVTIGRWWIFDYGYWQLRWQLHPWPWLPQQSRLYIFFSSSFATRTIIFYLWKHINEDLTRFNTSVNSVNLSPTKDKDVIRWIIEVKNLSKQYPGKPEYNDQYSITRKSYKGEILLESQSIIVNKKNLLQLRDKIDTLLNECM